MIIIIILYFLLNPLLNVHAQDYEKLFGLQTRVFKRKTILVFKTKLQTGKSILTVAFRLIFRSLYLMCTFTMISHYVLRCCLLLNNKPRQLYHYYNILHMHKFPSIRGIGLLAHRYAVERERIFFSMGMHGLTLTTYIVTISYNYIYVKAYQT